MDRSGIDLSMSGSLIFRGGINLEHLEILDWWVASHLHYKFFDLLGCRLRLYISRLRKL